MERILITYLNNGNLQSQVAKEVLFNRVVEDMIAEGKIVKSTTFQPLSKETIFNDGTKVSTKPFGIDVLGIRFTRLYIDELALTTPRAKEFVNQMYKAVVTNHEDMLAYSFDGKHITQRLINEYGI
jgi:hypothetical protein